MKQENSDILNQLGKAPGFKVPEHYFTDFCKDLTESLPEVEIEQPSAEKRTVWVRLRPYVYMAAMFAGVWCMFHVFNLYNGSAPTSRHTEMASGMQGDGVNPVVEQKSGDNAKLSYKDSIEASQQDTAVAPFDAAKR